LKFKIAKNEIILEKELNILDLFSLKITEIINKFFDYAIVGGYVAILFGRSRTTEDIDIIVFSREFSPKLLSSFYDSLRKEKFWVINAITPEIGYDYLSNGIGIRVAEAENVIPNAEIKLAKKTLDFKSIEEKVKVVLNNNVIYIGGLELNIAYKFYLGSQKDIEDAVHLFCLFKDILNIEKIVNYTKLLGVSHELVRRVLRC